MKFMMSVRSYSDLEHGISFPSGVTFARFLLMLTKEEQKEMLEARCAALLATIA